MTFPVWIGATNDGRMIIGARNMSRFDIVSKENVYGSQLPHRVVAETPDGYKIMTPTEAKENEYFVSDWGNVPAYRQWYQEGEE